MNAVTNLFWKIVFWWKKRTGLLDLGVDVTVTGTVEWSDFGKNPDGDFTMHVKPDPECMSLITLGTRRTSADPAYPETLHCEVTPWDAKKFSDVMSKLEAGDRVTISGRWAFDGVHTGKPEWLEVLYALVRHQPNMKDGWFEIHPVTEITITK